MAATAYADATTFYGTSVPRVWNVPVVQNVPYHLLGGREEPAPPFVERRNAVVPRLEPGRCLQDGLNENLLCCRVRRKGFAALDADGLERIDIALSRSSHGSAWTIVSSDSKKLRS